MKFKKKLLCLPIELYRREMIPKLYLAIKAAQQDYQVLIGYHDEYIFDILTDGLYLYKDHANWSEKRLRKQKSNRMIVSAFDEEGFIYDENKYSRTRGSKYLLDNLDAVFLWGESHYKTIKKISKDESNKFIVGSPKFDLYNRIRVRGKNENKWRSEKEKNKLKILINTRFTYVNGLRSGNEVVVLRDLGFINNKKDEEDFNIFLSDDRKIFKEFDRLIKILSTNNCIDVVIRPHPAEDLEFYKKYESLSSNVIVNNIEPMVEQILKSNIVIHDGCTTAIEARALGVPVLGLRPKGLVKPYSDYANNYSLNFTSAEGIYSYIFKGGNIEFLSEFMPVIDSLAKAGIANWNCSSSVIKMMEVLNGFNVPGKKLIRRSPICIKACFKSWFKRFIFNISENYFIRLILLLLYGSKKTDGFRQGFIVADSKFPLNSDLIVFNDVEYVCKILDCEVPKIRKISNKSYLLYYD